MTFYYETIITLENMNDTITVNSTDSGEDLEAYYAEYISKMDIITEVFLDLFTILSLVCITANILIIFVIGKYRRLRQEKANVIILNWAVLNSFFMFFQPITLRVSTYWLPSWSRTAFCVVEQSAYTTLSGCVLLNMLLLIYWFLKVYYPRKCTRFSNNLKLVLGSLYLVCIFALGVHINSCFNSAFFFLVAELVLVLVYLVFILFMVIMNIVHLVKKRKLIQTTVVSNIPLLLTNTYFLSIFPLLIIIIVQILTRINNIDALILMFTALMLAVMNPIYFFVILYKCDKDYKTFLSSVIKCQCNKYGDEMEEDPVVFNGNVQIQLQNDSLHSNKPSSFISK